MTDSINSSVAQAQTLHYRLCPKCARAVPATSSERFCINDGTRLLEACPHCGAAISSPYAHFCGACGLELTQTLHRRGK